jgi:hypothetical protein
MNHRPCAAPARPGAILVATALLCGTASASDLSYTYLEFGTLVTRSDFDGTRAVGLQTVSLDPGDGDGLAIAGSLAFGSRFYMTGSYRAAVVDTAAEVVSPLTTSRVDGSFDWTTARAGFGAVLPLGERLDLLAEIGYRTVHFDFGSFIGEDFDADTSGAELAFGLRFNPRERFELAVKAFTSDTGESNLSTGQFSGRAGIDAALRWYVFEDIGLGINVRSGDIRSLGASIRFGFGELRAGN